MAIVKDTTDYTDIHGNTYPNFYAVTDNVEIPNKNKKLAYIYLDIYKDQQHRDDYRDGNSAVPPVASCTHMCEDSDFDTYFSTSNLNGSNKNPYNQAYEYALTLPEWSGAKSDE